MSACAHGAIAMMSPDTRPRWRGADHSIARGIAEVYSPARNTPARKRSATTHHHANAPTASYVGARATPSAVETVPWDAHIRDASVMDWEALRRPTERAYISVAATLAKGFPTAGTIQARSAGAVQQ